MLFFRSLQLSHNKERDEALSNIQKLPFNQHSLKNI